MVGIDQSVTALGFAAHRTEQRGLTNVSFVHDDVRTVPLTGEFDAVVGRLVLLYLPDPVDVLHRFAGLVRPGGIVAVMEYEMTATGTLPPATLSEQVIFWLTESFRRSGLDARLGARLAPVMRRAGFDAATVLGVQGYCQAGDRDGPRMAAGIIWTLLPVLDKTDVATPDEVDLDTLEDRIARDCAHHDVIFSAAAEVPNSHGECGSPSRSA